MIGIGGYNLIATSEISSVLDLNSIQAKSYIDRIKDDALIIACATDGAGYKTAIIMKSGYAILTDISARTIRNRLYNAQSPAISATSSSSASSSDNAD